MKRFLIHTALFLFVVSLSCLAVYWQADGTTDAYYLKLTTDKQRRMIIGSSRVAQGLHPQVVDSVMGKSGLYNFGFTISQTPYGKPYYNAIEKKLDQGSKKSLYILEVNPWSIGKKITFKNEEDFWEEGSFITETQTVNVFPNLEYLIESFDYKNSKIIKNKKRKGEYQTYFVHDNGWVEVTIESDLILTQNRTSRKLDFYKKKLKDYQGISNYRKLYLERTIQLLKPHGRIVLLRMPVTEDMFILEEQLMPEFNSIMTNLEGKYNIDYINMMPKRFDYQYTDGHHLEVSSGHDFSVALAEELIAAKTPE